jgi:hypothetical protein
MAYDVRKITNKIYDAVNEGVLTWEQVATAALQFMSEDEVAMMAHNEEFFAYEEEEEEWSAETADFNDPGSIHHY